jgi:hypothetical protein
MSLKWSQLEEPPVSCEDNWVIETNFEKKNGQISHQPHLHVCHIKLLTTKPKFHLRSHASANPGWDQLHISNKI